MLTFWGIRAKARSAVRAMFPPKCLSCRRHFSEASAAGLCPACDGSLRIPPPNLCALCARPLDFTYEVDTGMEYFCGECRLNPPPFDAAIYAISYEGPVRDVIHAFKFGKSPYLARPLAEMGKNRLVPWLARRAGAVIVPVPLHWRRLYWRGYNHAYLLARQFGLMTGLEVEAGLLARTRHTPHQFGLSHQQRGENVRRAFQTPAPGRVAGRDIILLDDIITTGATARECCKALWKAKPKSVAVATLCKAGE